MTPVPITTSTATTNSLGSPSGPRPLQLLDGNVQTLSISTTSSCASPASITNGLPSPPPTTRKAANPRRQSSISYYPSDHTPYWEPRSPAATTVRRSHSIANANASTSTAAANKRNRRSTGSLEVDAAGERGPLTLTEKHADLLRFIAQKESKCLELRSQLAVHEAELAQLKRKWERVISRGVDRAYAAPPSPAPSGSGNAAVLDGIKEGVRLLAAGLGDLATPTPAPTPSANRSVRRVQGHAATHSTSSVSTQVTTSSSVRLSQSSASSFASDEPLRETDEREQDSAFEFAKSASAEPAVASALRATKIHRRKSRETPLASSPVLPSSPLASHPVLTPLDDTRGSLAKRASLNMASGLPPPGGIPGMGPITSPPVSAWMESVGSSVGRKWEEIQRGGTFTKSQKRASVLLSDVSQSIFAALSSPSTASASSPRIQSTFSNSTPQTPSPMTPAVSLLEDEDMGERTMLGSVLIPDAKTLSVPVRPMSLAGKGNAEPAKIIDDDDDEWNW